MKTSIAAALIVTSLLSPIALAETLAPQSSGSQAEREMNDDLTTSSSPYDVTQISEESFKAVDRNSDGQISKAEASHTPYEQAFTEMDVDQDGMISLNEMVMMHGAPTAAGQSETPSDGLYE